MSGSYYEFFCPVKIIAGHEAIGHIPFELTPGTPVGPTCRECAYQETCPDAAPVLEPEWGEEARQADRARARSAGSRWHRARSISLPIG